MAQDPKKNVTQLLRAWNKGDQKAKDELFALIYKELRRTAAAYMRNERPNHTLQPTALVNEAYLKLLGESGTSWESRGHFYGVAARAMRQVLVDYARARGAEKRGAGKVMLPLDEALAWAEERDIDLIALDEALQRLEKDDLRRSMIIDVHFFGGLTIEQTAEVMGISDATVKRELRLGKAWLRREISPDD